MAKIRIIYRILPSEVGDEILNKILAEINSNSSSLNYIVNDYKTEPIAFGLNALKILLTFDEDTGRLDRFEEMLNNMPEVSSWEVIGMTRA